MVHPPNILYTILYCILLYSASYVLSPRDRRPSFRLLRKTRKVEVKCRFSNHGSPASMHTYVYTKKLAEKCVVPVVGYTARVRKCACVRMNACLYVCTWVCSRVCIICMHACMNARMCGRMYVCMYVCMLETSLDRWGRERERQKLRLPRAC